MANCKICGKPVQVAPVYHAECLDAAMAALREKQERENPKPLTEDDLRQMMGEPVWCVYEGGASWFIVHESLFTIFNGVTAYRCKPAEVPP